jgi:type IV pilus assembly protein PilA
MKKTSNKGFSMVELIIVIAIMAILAAALAPSLIKYINKSRLSTDVQTGSTIASAINSALAVEKAYDDASIYDKKDTEVNSILSASDSFGAEVANVVGATSVSGKSKKDLAGSQLSQTFYCYIDVANNKVTVWYGTAADSVNHQVSPTPGPSMTE